MMPEPAAIADDPFPTLPPSQPPASSTVDSLATCPPAADAPTSAVLGHYQLLEELGRGGMGVVYRAIDQKRGRQVALKTIRGLSSEAVYRFKQEFRLRADLQHPNLVNLYELIADADCWFFTMELIEGSHFLHHVRAGGAALGSPLPQPLTLPEQWQRLRHALRQLAEGVEVLHAAGRLHRDLKPSNVLVTRAGRVVLLDFGLMARLNAENLHESTERHLSGTVFYMSPEQARSEPLSPASDWYSVGVMLYEALTGRLPFTGSLFRVLSNKQKQDPPPPRTLAPDIPEDLEALCLGLLSRDPAARPCGCDCLRILGAPSAENAPYLELPVSDVALVGREEPLAALNDAYTASRKRRTVVLFLSGSSGIGKSSLLQLFLDQLRSEGEAVVLTGQCYEQESVPYKAFDGVIDDLSRFLRRLSPLEVQALLPREVASLLRVFPMLRRVDALLSVPQGHEAPDPQEVRQRAFASLRELFARLADRKPVVICIDDLQWGDADSASLLAELVRPPDAPRLLFVSCHRKEEIASPFLAALAETNRVLWSEVDRREVVLAPLPAEKAAELAAVLLDREDSTHAAAIAREAGGNPFFVHELVRHVRAETGRALTEGTIDLCKVLWDRIGRLPTEARELLAVVALAARPLPQDVACRAAGLAPGRIEELTLLRSQRLARGSGMSGDDLLVTYHDRIREAFRVDGDTEHTRQLHGRIAERLEAWGGADPEWLATHWEKAGDLRRAGDYYGRAADQAAETLAFDNAADLYRRALRMGAEDAGLRRRWQRKLGDALANAGRGGEAAKAYQALIADAFAGERMELQRKVAEQFLISGYVEEGFAASEALLESVGMRMPRSPARAVLGILLMRVCLWLRGTNYQERSEAEVPGRDLDEVDSSWVMATSLSFIDTIRGAYFQIRNLLLALKVGEPYRIARALALAASYSACAGSAGRHRTSRLFKLSKELTERSENIHARGMVLLTAGAIAYLEGRWRDAFHASSCAENFFKSNCTGAYWELNTAQAFAMYSLVFLGEPATLSRLCPQFMQDAQRRGDLHGYATVFSLAKPLLNMAANCVEDGIQELTEEMKRWTEKKFQVQRSVSLYMRTHVFLYVNEKKESEQAARDMHRSIREWRLTAVQHLRMVAWEVMGRSQIAVASELKAPSAYLHAAERSARHLDREKRPDARSLATLIRAGIANCKGDLDKAKKLLELAVSGLAACELGLFTAAARRRLGQLIGGDQGKSLVAEADDWMTAQGIRNPVRMTAVYAPGFADP